MLYGWAVPMVESASRHGRPDWVNSYDFLQSDLLVTVLSIPPTLPASILQHSSPACLPLPSDPWLTFSFTPPKLQVLAVEKIISFLRLRLNCSVTVLAAGILTIKTDIFLSSNYGWIIMASPLRFLLLSNGKRNAGLALST